MKWSETNLNDSLFFIIKVILNKITIIEKRLKTFLTVSIEFEGVLRKTKLLNVEHRYSKGYTGIEHTIVGSKLYFAPKLYYRSGGEVQWRRPNRSLVTGSVEPKSKSIITAFHLLSILL